ncbi:hypothetical protein [Pontibacter sp. G13]|uniref:hypothetical protein n=1 Tax=Pontibacter sp. G13 TaxID=3074898 RepID=UPI00288A9ABC|nr:hypothetical protein [Pontibacter sp. G13]WNJ19071.1 hypothetical protein RJD25_01150 [Pontibacter sp. G13]
MLNSPGRSLAILLVLGMCIASCTAPRQASLPTVSLTLLDSIQHPSKLVSVQLHATGPDMIGYTTGEGKTAEAYVISESGKLEMLAQYSLTERFGGARALTPVNISGTEFLLLGNKAENALEVYRIESNGALEKIHEVFDTDSTFIDEIVTIHAVELEGRHFIYAGGLDEGFSCFELTNAGKLIHIQSIADTDAIHVHGMIGMSSMKIGDELFLFTGAFFDNGVSSFRVMENGHLAHVASIEDDETLFLDGAFAVNTVQLGGRHFLLAGHRHTVHYKGIEGAAERYHGDGINVFEVSANGEMTLHDQLKDDENIRLKGNTRIELIQKNSQEALVFIATRDDHGIQVCSMQEDGILRPIQSLDLGYGVYNGMTVQKLNGTWYLLVGAYEGSTLELYEVGI